MNLRDCDAIHGSNKTNYMLQSPSGEADRASDYKKIQYSSHNSPPLIPIQRQCNPKHILHLPFFKLNFHITASSTSNSSQ